MRAGLTAVIVVAGILVGLVALLPTKRARAAEPAADVAEPFELTIKDARPPSAGNATTIVTRSVVDKLTIVYSPSSNVADVETVKANGTELILWRPLRPGVAEISAPGHASKRISIRFDGIPLSGVVIMLIAGFILFGGAFISLRMLLASDS